MRKRAGETLPFVLCADRIDWTDSADPRVPY